MSQDDCEVRAPGDGKRFVALDSLRGLAAITVVILHFLIMWLPADGASLSRHQSWLLALLSPLFAGSDAVILFFVLSGFVLAMPFLQGRVQPYPRFVLRRIVRIYLPYYGALAAAFAAAGIWRGHRYINHWAQPFWNEPWNLGLVVNHLLLIGVYKTHPYDFVIWTLVEEMRISLIFPLLFWLVMRRGWKSAFMAALLISCLASLPSLQRGPVATSLLLTVHYASFFIVGICMAAQLSRIEGWWHRQSRLVIGGLLAAGFIFYGYAGLLSAFLQLHSGNARLWATLTPRDWFAGLGAVTLILGAVFSASVKSLLLLRLPHFLGKISYSLYLIHPVVLGAMAFSALGYLNLGIQFVLYIGLAVLGGQVLWWLVERHAIRWSRRV